MGCKEGQAVSTESESSKIRFHGERGKICPWDMGSWCYFSTWELFYFKKTKRIIFNICIGCLCPSPWSFPWTWSHQPRQSQNPTGDAAFSPCSWAETAVTQHLGHKILTQLYPITLWTCGTKICWQLLNVMALSVSLEVGSCGSPDVERLCRESHTESVHMGLPWIYSLF